MSIKDSSIWQRRRRFKGDKGRDMSEVTCPDCHKKTPKYYYAGHRLQHPGNQKRYNDYMSECNERLKRLERDFES